MSRKGFKFIVECKEVGVVKPVGSFYSFGRRDYCAQIDDNNMETFAKSDYELESCGFCMLPDGKRLYSANINGVLVLAAVSDMMMEPTGEILCTVSIFGMNYLCCFRDKLEIIFTVSEVYDVGAKMFMMLSTSISWEKLGTLYVGADVILLNGVLLAPGDLQMQYTKALTCGYGVVVK